MALKHRLFFAISPDAPTRARMAALAEQLAQDYPARWIRPARYHLTLLFLGSTDHFDAARAGQAMQAAARVHAPAFTWRADTVRSLHAPRPPCVLAASRRGGPLLRLRMQLSGALAGAGIAAADRRPYVPHVTLGYGRGGTVHKHLSPPLAFAMTAFALLHSIDGARDYAELGRWPLAPMGGRAP